VVNYYIIYLAGSELLQFLIYLLGIWNAVLDVLVPDLDPIVFICLYLSLFVSICLYLSLFVSICFFQVFLYHEYASPGPWFKPFWFKPCFTSGDIYILYHIISESYPHSTTPQATTFGAHIPRPLPCRTWPVRRVRSAGRGPAGPGRCWGHDLPRGWTEWVII